MKSLMAKLTAMGPLGLLLIASLDGMGVPLPGGVDFLLVVLSAARPDQAWLLASLASLGSVLGGLFLFRLARKGGEAFLDKRTASGRGARFRRWFLKYGLLTVFVPAFAVIPMPLKLFVFCAGALGVRWRSFLLVLVAARVPRYLGLAYLGSRYGNDAWPWLKSHGWQMAAIAAAIFVLAYLVIRRVQSGDRLAQAEATLSGEGRPL